MSAPRPLAELLAAGLGSVPDAEAARRLGITRARAHQLRRHHGIPAPPRARAIAVRLPADLIARIDSARGEVSREQWIAEAVAAQLLEEEAEAATLSPEDRPRVTIAVDPWTAGTLEVLGGKR